MKRVYRAATLLEAQLVADTLASLGIHNHILNTYAAGAMGELPYSQTSPEVWIADPAQEARACEAVTALGAPLLPDKLCCQCHEINPGNFLSCWQCGSALGA
jgi:hypothetical protein